MDGIGTVDPVAALNDRAFGALGAFLAGDVPLNQTLDQLARLACLAVPGCEMVGITLYDGETPITAIHTHADPPRIDEAQYHSGRGPCLDAMRFGEIQCIEDTAADERWPEFSRAAVEVGVRATLALPLRVGDRVVGGFNLYSHEPTAFASTASDTAGLFAAQAALAVGSALAYWHQHGLVQHLEEALKSRPVIDQAKGMIMAQQGVTADEAFDVLRRASQRQNRKLRDVAAEMIDAAVARARANRNGNGNGNGNGSSEI
jgi:GAF domain-containing protein